MSWRLLIIGFVLFALSGWGASVSSAEPARRLCPAVGIQQRGATFQPGGIILTTFDRGSLWVYNIDRNTRYPLPDSAPCGTNCHLSYDARWFTYLNARDRIFSKMRLDGTERTPLARDAHSVGWWDADTLLIWTSGGQAFLRPEGSTDNETLDTRGVLSVQPGGRWALTLEQAGDDFLRVLVNMDTRYLSWVEDQRVELGISKTYFNAAAWSPDGHWLAYVIPGTYDSSNGIAGAEIFGVRPGSGQPEQWTDLYSMYGAARVNGMAPGDLSWSPDGTRLAFWVTEMLGADPEGRLGQAMIHILDIESGALTVYCGYATDSHTPTTPRLVWSPDGTHIAFGGYVEDRTRGALLLVLDTNEGVFTELSAGIFPALGHPDVITWGLPPR